MAKKPSRRDLLRVVCELQGIIGALGAAYGNDRAPDRADRVQRLVTRGFDLCVATLGADPPTDLDGFLAAHPDGRELSPAGRKLARGRRAPAKCR